MRKLNLYITEKLHLDKDTKVIKQVGDIKNYTDLVTYLKDAGVNFKEINKTNKFIVIYYDHDIELELEFPNDNEYWYTLYLKDKKYFYSNTTSHVEKVDWELKIDIVEWCKSQLKKYNKMGSSKVIKEHIQKLKNIISMYEKN